MALSPAVAEPSCAAIKAARPAGETETIEERKSTNEHGNMTQPQPKTLEREKDA